MNSFDKEDLHGDRQARVHYTVRASAGGWLQCHQTLTRVLFIVCLHTALGIWYCGPQFFRHFIDGIPHFPQGGHASYMASGDTFQQFHRYALVYYNLSRGRAPYYQGDQYNIQAGKPAFTEGLIFFPLSFITGLVAFLFDPIPTYNLLIFLSYPLTGLVTFLFLYRITRSTASSALGSVILSLLPFRTAFLNGELVFGVDLWLMPLCALLYEIVLEKPRLSSYLWLSVALFSFATANPQCFYLFLFWTGLYFAAGFMGRLRSNATRRVAFSAGVLGAFMPALAYLAYVGTLMESSGRGSMSKAAAMDEVRAYMAAPKHFLIVFSGNETTLFLGIPLVAVVLLILWFGLDGLAENMDPRQRRIAATLGAMFLPCYLFGLGPNLDRLLRLPVFETYFYHFPGATVTRTPGRAMAVAGFIFAVMLALVWRAATQRIEQRYANVGRKLCLAVGLLLGVGIAVQYNYLSPSMSVLERNNTIYRQIAGSSGRVLALPFQAQPGHHLNSVFLYYAQKYDLRMFNGHSSMFPRDAVEASSRLSALNTQGTMSAEVWHWLLTNDFRYIVVHDAGFEPRIQPLALYNLKHSPYLQLEASKDGFYRFGILAKPRDISKADEELDYEEISRSLSKDRTDLASSPVVHVAGWYSREAYPQQEPFRWMNGTSSTLLILQPPQHRIEGLTFEVKCPAGDLTVSEGKQRTTFTADPAAGWRRIAYNLGKSARKYSVIMLETSKVYTVPTDPRVFGCMVSDIVAEPTVSTRVSSRRK